jgi:translation initiation factor 2 subunit 2
MADASEVVDDEVKAMFDLKLKKKKKKKVKSEAAEGDESENVTGGDKAESKDEKEAAPSSEKEVNYAAGEVDPPTYSYNQLLNRVVDLLHANNPEFNEKRRFTMKPPQLMRVGTKKTLWTNFQEICNTMKRNPDHVFQFMMAELGTEGSIDGNQRLVIRGKFVPRYIESLLRKYVGEYVQCQMCRSYNTTLKRDQNSRLYFVECIPADDGKGGCGSSRSVAPIRAGYHAQTRADRRAIRNAP